MGWLSLCVCGTKRDSNDGKIKKDGKRKKSKKSKKNSKQKGSCKAPPFIVEEFLRKSQDEQPKEIAEKDWANGEIVNYLSDDAKNQFGSTNQIDPSKINGSPSCQISDGREVFEKVFSLSSERNADESARESCDTDYYGCDVMLHSRCASSTADESEKQEYISDEKEHNEEIDLDESIPRSGEPEDSSWTSEIEEAVLDRSLDRKLVERISSRINFSKEEQGKPKARASPRKKGTRYILPPIKRPSRAEARSNNEEAHGETSKFGFKRTAASRDGRLEIRRKLNSCSFEVRPDEERGGKATRIRGEGSMIPRLASPMRLRTNPSERSKHDSDKSEIVHNGTSYKKLRAEHLRRKN